MLIIFIFYILKNVYLNIFLTFLNSLIFVVLVNQLEHYQWKSTKSSGLYHHKTNFCVVCEILLVSAAQNLFSFVVQFWQENTEGKMNFQIV